MARWLTRPVRVSPDLNLCVVWWRRVCPIPALFCLFLPQLRTDCNCRDRGKAARPSLEAGNGLRDRGTAEDRPHQCCALETSALAAGTLGAALPCGRSSRSSPDGMEVVWGVGCVDRTLGCLCWLCWNLGCDAKLTPADPRSEP